MYPDLQVEQVALLAQTLQLVMQDWQVEPLRKSVVWQEVQLVLIMLQVAQLELQTRHACPDK